MRSIAERRHRFGSPRVYRELRADGWHVNHKRIERLWREESMQVPAKQHRRRRLPGGCGENSCIRRCAQHKDHVWSYDFVAVGSKNSAELKSP
ncbi:MAG TPA: transposase [Fuerstia sp.]|nr:transposase [Fuerstiella sp.]